MAGKTILTLAVPASTQWQPNLAGQLAVGLFSFSQPLSLGIVATKQRIGWYLELDSQLMETVTQTLYASYPQAQIRSQPKTSAHVGYQRYPLHASAPFIFPLKYVQDFTGLDPLSTLVSGMTKLNSGESIVYEMTLASPRPDYAKWGTKLFNERAYSDPADVRRILRSKLEAPFKEVTLSIKVKAESTQRCNQLVAQLWPGLAIFEREGFCELVSPHKKSFQLVLSAAEVAALWHLPSEQMQTPGIVWTRSGVAPIPQTLANQHQGIVLGTNTFQGNSHPVRLTYPDRVTHVNLIGKSGVGKSTLLHRMAHEDIAAGKGVAVVDPHGDLVADILKCSIPAEREGDVVLLDIADEAYPIGLNLLAPLPGVKAETIVGQALGVIRKIFAEQWSATQMEDALYAALMALVNVSGASLLDLPRLFINPAFRTQALASLTDPIALEFWHDDFGTRSPGDQRRLSQPIQNRIRKFLRNPTLRRILGQADSLNFRHILDRRQIFLASLGGLEAVEKETLGALLISKFQMAAMSRTDLAEKKRYPCYLYIDEVQNFVTTSLNVMFSEARKYGLSLTVANQFLRQLKGDTLEALLGNVGTTIIFRTGPQDTQDLAPFVRPQFSGDDLLNLDRFNTAVSMQLDGQTLPAFSMVTHTPPMPLADGEARIGRIVENSRTRYGRFKAEVDQDIAERYRVSGAPAKQPAVTPQPPSADGSVPTDEPVVSEAVDDLDGLDDDFFG